MTIRIPTHIEAEPIENSIEAATPDAQPVAPQTVRDWYRLSNTLSPFYEALPTLDGPRLAELVAAAIDMPPRGKLRTRAQLERQGRRLPPAIEELQRATGREQTLQWMFMRRGYFTDQCEKVVARELPTCCVGEVRHGAADLLVMDERTGQPVLVELKRASANDPLSRCVLEVLWHWTFAVQHLGLFKDQLAEFGYPGSTGLPRLAIAAPERFFEDGQGRSLRRRVDERALALSWVAHLRDAGIVDIDLYAIENDWQNVGQDFRMQKVSDEWF